MANNYYSSSSSSSHQPTFPLHLFIFLLVLLAFLSFTWYANFDDIIGQLFDLTKLVVVVSPLVLLMLMHVFSFWEKSWGFFPFTERPGVLLPFPDQDTLHRAGGTPWGVGLVLVVILFLWCYQSDFRERWFPLFS